MYLYCKACNLILHVPAHLPTHGWVWLINVLHIRLGLSGRAAEEKPRKRESDGVAVLAYGDVGFGRKVRTVKDVQDDLESLGVQEVSAKNLR